MGKNEGCKGAAAKAWTALREGGKGGDGGRVETWRRGALPALLSILKGKKECTKIGECEMAVQPGA